MQFHRVLNRKIFIILKITYKFKELAKNYLNFNTF